MNNCIQTMMEEHELILRVLGALDAAGHNLESGMGLERQDLAEFGRFFRDFADKCHHGKEEDRLFAKMIESGFPRESGPIAVMLYEHEAGRAEVRQLIKIGSGSGPLSAEETAQAMGSIEQFIPLLFAHIQKENTILYPMAQRSIPAEQFEGLNRTCAQFDQDIQGRLDVAGLKRLADDLIQRYPARADFAEAFITCGGCGATHG